MMGKERIVIFRLFIFQALPRKQHSMYKVVSVSSIVLIIINAGIINACLLHKLLIAVKMSVYLFEYLDQISPFSILTLS